MRTHRRKISNKIFDNLTGVDGKKIQKIAILLRLAVLLHRSRRDRAFRDLKVVPGENSLKLVFPNGWLDDHPLNEADLGAERKYLEGIGFKLSFK